MSARSWYAGTVVLGEDLNAGFITDPNNGVGTTVTGTPAFIIYAADMGSVLVTSQNAGTPSDTPTGVYRVSYTISSGNGFEAGKSYTARITYVISGTTYTQLARFTVI